MELNFEIGFQLCTYCSLVVGEGKMNSIGFFKKKRKKIKKREMMGYHIEIVTMRSATCMNIVIFFVKSCKTQLSFLRCFHVMWGFCTVWKLREFTLTHFWQKFRKSNGLITYNKVKSWFDEIFYWWENFSFFHTHSAAAWKNISSNWLFSSNFFGKNVIFT